MIDFLFPSDQDRADNDDLDRTCDALEEMMDENTALREATENATGILCGHALGGTTPLEVMARKVMKENAALAAQVLNLKYNVMNILMEAQPLEYSPVPNRLKIGMFVSKESMIKMGAIIESIPDDILAQRDALMKAEALEEMRDACWGLNIKTAALAFKDRAAEYRKQAEEV